MKKHKEHKGKVRKRGRNKWFLHVEEFRRDYPDMPYGDALREAKKNI